MKKLLSFLAVAAIVTSAFAFTTKSMVATFCVLNDLGTDCEVIDDMRIVDGTANNEHFPLGLNQWNGTAANCTGVANCSVPIRLLPN